MLNNSGALNKAIGLSGDLLRDEIERIMERAAIANKLGNLDGSEFAGYSAKVVRGGDEPPSVPEPGGETRKNVLTAYLDDSSGSPADSDLLRKLENDGVYPGLVRAVANHPEPDYVAQKINRLAKNHFAGADDKSGSILLAGMLSGGIPYSAPPSAETVLGHARHLTNQMTKDGLRSDFFWENGWHSRTYGGNYLSCVHQAEYLKPLMEKEFPDWKFEVDAGPFHTVLIGIPPGWNEPNLKLDPWYGSFSVISE